MRPLVLREPESDEERLASCARHIAGRLSSARRPAVLIDMDAERFGVLQEVDELAEKLQLPVATMSSSKGIFSEQSPCSPASTSVAPAASNCEIWLRGAIVLLQSVIAESIAPRVFSQTAYLIA